MLLHQYLIGSILTDTTEKSDYNVPFCIVPSVVSGEEKLAKQFGQSNFCQKRAPAPEAERFSVKDAAAAARADAIGVRIHSGFGRGSRGTLFYSVVDAQQQRGRSAVGSGWSGGKCCDAGRRGCA